jgi:hypothetical protein
MLCCGVFICLDERQARSRVAQGSRPYDTGNARSTPAADRIDLSAIRLTRMLSGACPFGQTVVIRTTAGRPLRNALALHDIMPLRPHPPCSDRCQPRAERAEKSCPVRYRKRERRFQGYKI